MNPLRPALALLLATTLCAAGLPTASAVPARTRSAVGPEIQRAAPTRSSESTPNVADNTLIVRLKDGPTARSLEQVYAAADTSAGAVSVIRGDILSWKVPTGETITGFAEKLESTGKVTYAEPNFVRTLAGYTPPDYAEPDDPAYLDTATWSETFGGITTGVYPRAKSWWIRDVNGTSAWKTGYTGSNIIGKYPLRSSGPGFKVAVLDTGFFTSHPDKSSYIVAGSSSIEPADASLALGGEYWDKVAMVSHGTCVAGIIGAAVNNGEGTLGVANDTRVAIYKVYTGGSGIADAVIIAAIRKAADDGCRVINMSLAGGDYNSALQDAINYAWGKGCVIVAASGNEYASVVSYPARMENVVAVGALDRDANAQLKRASYSNYGAELDISAPGSWVWGLNMPGYTDPDDGSPGYKWWDGTSMASPVVAGGIAWLWRAMPSLTNQEIIDLVESTATDMGSAGRDNAFGYGELNLTAAYNKLTTDYPLLSKPTVSVDVAPDGLSANVAWTAVPGFGITYDVTVDGEARSTGLAATSLPVSLAPKVTSLNYSRGQLTWSHTLANGQHEIVVTPRSTRNWADGTEKSVSAIVTSSGSSHIDSLTIDGQPISVTDNGVSGSLNTASLGLGQHQAIMHVTDGLGNVSPPVTCTFTVRPSPTIRRVTGADRYAYATTLSRAEFTTATTAVLVSGASWADALAAAPLAHVVRGPVLVTTRTSLPKTTKLELARLHVKRIVIVGDTGDVSSSLRNALAKGYSVSRITGSDRYAKADAIARSIAKRSDGSAPDRKVVLVGAGYPDALAASAVAARKGWPLLYTRQAGLSKSTRSAISAVHATSTLVVGGGSMVSAAARKQLPASTRITGGSTSQDTAYLAQWATSHYPSDFNGERIYVASNIQWRNGLGLPAAAAQKGTLVLATSASLAPSVRGYYVANSEIAVTTRIIASSSSIGSAAYNTIKGIVGAP